MPRRRACKDAANKDKEKEKEQASAGKDGSLSVSVDTVDKHQLRIFGIA